MLQIIEKMDQAKEVISLRVCSFSNLRHSRMLYIPNLYQVTVFNKPVSLPNSRDLSLCDMDIGADIKRLRVMLIFSFLARVQVQSFSKLFNNPL